MLRYRPSHMRNACSLTLRRWVASLTEGRREPEERPYPLAIAHDYLTQRGGAERVVLALHKAFPQAPIYTTLYDPEGTFPEFREATVITSPLNHIRVLRRHHRVALPLLPLASTLIRIPARSTLISSTGWAHGFSGGGARLVYCHSPARWLYLSEQYLGERDGSGPIAWALKALWPGLRAWDRWSAHRGDQPYLANSTVTRQRIRDTYGMDVPILFPPHALDTEGPAHRISGLGWEEGSYHLIVSRLLPYKNVQHAIEAVRGTEHRLLVVGAGPLLEELRAQAPENVRFATGIPDAQMRWAYANARAVLAVSYEDFGLTPIEGAAYGRPTLALRAGGFLDTVREGVTGMFIDEPTAPKIREALDAFRPEDFNAARIREHAGTFSEERFIQRLREHAALQGLSVLA